jgi:hypothetical protein
MILPLSLSSRKKNSLTTRTTHKEELEYIGITLGELMRLLIQKLRKKFRGAQKDSKG